MNSAWDDLLEQLSVNNWELNIITGKDATTLTYSITVPRVDTGNLLSSLFKPQLPNQHDPKVTIPSAAGNEIPHPGVYLQGLLVGNNIKKQELQDSLEMTISYVNDFLNGQKPLSVEHALKLETHFKKLNRTADFWVQMQAQYDLQERRKKRAPMPPLTSQS